LEDLDQWPSIWVSVPPGVCEDILRGTRKHLAGYVKLKKEAVFNDFRCRFQTVYNLIYTERTLGGRYEVEEKLPLEVREQRRLNTTDLRNRWDNNTYYSQ
jgi:hypothetical protein